MLQQRKDVEEYSFEKEVHKKYIKGPSSGSLKRCRLESVFIPPLNGIMIQRNISDATEIHITQSQSILIFSL